MKVTTEYVILVQSEPSEPAGADALLVPGSLSIVGKTAATSGPQAVKALLEEHRADGKIIVQGSYRAVPLRSWAAIPVYFETPAPVLRIGWAGLDRLAATAGTGDEADGDELVTRGDVEIPEEEILEAREQDKALLEKAPA